jgi:predicted AAA+ superfamily ATPase
MIKNRNIFKYVSSDLRDKMIFIGGPRQVGKTTAAKQIIDQLSFSSTYATADAAIPHGPEWIETQWQLAQSKLNKSEPTLLVLDELQKVRGWSEILKRLWDTRTSDIRVLVLGSSALLLRQGMSESLAGRFYLNRFTHWSLSECNDAFGWDLNQWLYFGGYPGAAIFTDNEAAWKQYVSDSLIETVLSKDVLQTDKITKPSLLRNLFGLTCSFPSQIFSYNKMLGQLSDAGNTTTLAHYLKLLDNAFLATGLERFSKGQVRKRGSSPKLLLWNNALISALSPKTFIESIHNSSWWGRVVENAVGAHILNDTCSSPRITLTYWNKGNYEVDFVVQRGEDIVALEIKSGRPVKSVGLSLFKKAYPTAKMIIVGSGGIPLEVFFNSHVEDLLFS